MPIKVKWLKNQYEVDVMLDESVLFLRCQVRPFIIIFEGEGEGEGVILSGVRITVLPVW